MRIRPVYRVLRRTFRAHAAAHEDVLARSTSPETREAFWRDFALSRVDWIVEPSSILTILKKNDWPGPLYQWFPDAKVNMCYNAVDRHVAKRGSQIAIAYDSAVGGDSRNITYSELLEAVERCAGALVERGVVKGDCVLLYMPMIPEAVIAMLACARIGAVHSVVFGGFAAPELAQRIQHAEPKVVITASCGLEGASKVLAYAPLLSAALELADHVPQTVLLHQRANLPAELPAAPETDAAAAEGGAPAATEWEDAAAALAAAPRAPCAALRATDPLYILYTSGTTGQPKGIVRDNAHLVPLLWTMDHFFKCAAGETFWAASDLGWVVGHSYICYAPLLQGCTTVLYEGKPVGTPDAGAFWRVAAQHNVTSMFTAPTALRAIRRDDPTLALRREHKTPALRALFVAGERADPDTVNFFEKVSWLFVPLHFVRILLTTFDLLPGPAPPNIFAFEKALETCPVVDNWWQTETGFPICGMQDSDIGTRAGSCGMAMPGFALRVVDAESGATLPVGTEGAIVAEMPLPPGCMTTLWGPGGDARYVEASAYLDGPLGTTHYVSGDAGRIDAEGYVHVMARTDDVLNVAGHRLSSGALEEALLGHRDVVEAAVIGPRDDLKGSVPVGLVVLGAHSGGAGRSAEAEALIVDEIVALVRSTVGAVAAFKQCAVVAALPKTRSGKILRGAMTAIANGDEYTLPGTIEDSEVIPSIAAALAALQYPPEEQGGGGDEE